MGVTRDGVVVAFKRGERGGVGANDRDGANAGLEGEEAGVVLEQDHGFPGGIEGERVVGGRTDNIERDAGVGDPGWGIEEAQTVAGEEEAFEGDVDLGLADKPFVYGAGKRTVGVAAVGIGSGADACDRGGFGVRREAVTIFLEEVVDGAAIGGDEAAEVPITAEDGLEQLFVRAGGRSIDGVVGAHDRVGFRFGDGGAEGGEVGIPEVVRCGVYVGGVAGGFRAAVDGVVLGGGDDPKVGGIVALETFDEGHAEAAGEERDLRRRFPVRGPSADRERC